MNKLALVLAVSSVSVMVACGVPDDQMLGGGKVLSPDAVSTDKSPSSSMSSPEISADEEDQIVVDSCFVKLVYCADSRHLDFPSYCEVGCKTFDQAFNAAKSLCKHTCGNINCAGLVPLGHC